VFPGCLLERGECVAVGKLFDCVAIDMCFALGILDDDPLMLIVTGFEEAEGAARRGAVGLVWRGVELALTAGLEGLGLVPVLVTFGETLETVF